MVVRTFQSNPDSYDVPGTILCVQHIGCYILVLTCSVVLCRSTCLVHAAMREGGVSGLGIRDDGAARPPYGKACGSYSAATSEAMAISKARVFCNDTISA